jgi:4-carboxymuconolactone decarboxylase
VVVGRHGATGPLMAELPDPTAGLSEEDRAALEQIAAVRSATSGHRAPAQVYVRMFNNPGVARAVGQLGEHLRFHGVLPDRERELAILRFAARERIAYEWAHHQRVAERAGIDPSTMAALVDPAVPGWLDEPDRAVLEAVDATVDRRPIPPEVQERLAASFGWAGVVEVVALCGLYCLMGGIVTAFDIGVEDGLPAPPF